MTRRRPDPIGLDPVGDAVRGLLDVRGRSRQRRPAPPADVPAGLAALERLDRLEREVQEVRTRIHALFFAVLTAGLGDLAGRLVLG